MVSCLPLLQEHPKREEFLDVLIDAGESAWIRGAHEVRRCHGLVLSSIYPLRSWLSAPSRVRGLCCVEILGQAIPAAHSTCFRDSLRA
jgi:hypothetical protein